MHARPASPPRAGARAPENASDVSPRGRAEAAVVRGVVDGGAGAEGGGGKGGVEAGPGASPAFVTWNQLPIA